MLLIAQGFDDIEYMQEFHHIPTPGYGNAHTLGGLRPCITRELPFAAITAGF